MTLDDPALDPPPRDEPDTAVDAWGTCSCNAFVRGWAYEEAPTVEAVCLECNAWVVAPICERPRCECGDRADDVVGGMAVCSWCANRGQPVGVRHAAE